jgi:hypothetical protein
MEMKFHYLVFIAITLITLFLIRPWLFNLTGDAQVHLAIAERVSKGHPFHYNPSGEIVSASTSPFWTLMLALFFLLVGAYSPLLLKVTVLIIWAGTGYLLYRTARDLWHFQGYLLLAVIGWWLTNTTIISNGLAGMENILSALQLLLVYHLSTKWWRRLSYRKSAAMGLILGWSILTRPEVGIFCSGTIAFSFIAERLLDKDERLGLVEWAKSLCLLVFVTLVVISPWYVYQYQMTGQLVSDSSIARLYAGRQGSIMLLSNIIYFHPKALISLVTAFLPVTLGAAIATIAYGVKAARKEYGRDMIPDDFPQLLALLVPIIGFGFYSFVVGAESFGRYFLPIFPFLLLNGVAGLHHLAKFLQWRRKLLSSVLFVLATLFMLMSSGVDHYRRVILGQFESGPILNVIYGPANLQYFSYNLRDIVEAPHKRPQHTAELGDALGKTTNRPIRFAVTEVQLRYFLDDSISILSLDGRTSATILNYYDSASGVPDFESYFIATRPDFVHVAQWCSVGGWLARVSETSIRDNLVCEWKNRIDDMQTGESFDWNGHQIRYVAPDIVQIMWPAKTKQKIPDGTDLTF